MYLPLMDETHTGPAPEEAADIRKGRGRIMVIDDEEPVRDVCSELARYLGYTPVPFSTGEEAVSWFGRHTADVTAVILDVQMPGLTGGQVLTQLKKIDARVPVIVTTGYNIGMDTQALLKDASFYLQKPFDLQKLSDAISAVMGPG